MLHKILAGLFLAAASTLAFADPAVAGNPNPMGQWVMIAIFGVIFYFLILRPQSKRAKMHQTLLSGLQKDDEVLTTGGLVGRVVRVGDSFVTLVVGSGIQVHVQKQAIVSAVPRGTLHAVEAA